MQTSERLDYIDAAKGIALLFVIYGHTFRESMRAAYTWCDLSYVFVYRFHVSLLFILSGMGYALTAEKNKSLSAKQYLSKKVRSVLLPWFSYSVVIYVLFSLVQLVPNVRALLRSTSYAWITPAAYAVDLLRNENPYSFHLWYLQTLFLFLLVTYVLDRILPARSVRTVKLLLILLLPGFYSIFCKSWIWTFKGFFQKYIFFLLGTLLPRNTLERHAGKVAVAGAIGGLFMFYELFHPLTAFYEHFPLGLLLDYLDTLAILCFCLGILSLCILFQSRLHLMAHFGRNTMLFYLYHQPFCCAVVGMILYDKLHFPAGVSVVLCIICSLFLPYLFHRLVCSSRLSKFLHRVGLPA